MCILPKSLLWPLWLDRIRYKYDNVILTYLSSIYFIAGLTLQSTSDLEIYWFLLLHSNNRLNTVGYKIEIFMKVSMAQNIVAAYLTSIHLTVLLALMTMCDNTQTPRLRITICTNIYFMRTSNLRLVELEIKHRANQPGKKNIIM